jgi:hypothetical protein
MQCLNYKTDLMTSVNPQSAVAPEDIDPGETQEWLESLQAICSSMT